jgi:hypothetical protein
MGKITSQHPPQLSIHNKAPISSMNSVHHADSDSHVMSLYDHAHPNTLGFAARPP